MEWRGGVRYGARMRILSLVLVATALFSACGGESPTVSPTAAPPANPAPATTPASQPAAAARQLTLTYFTMSG